MKKKFVILPRAFIREERLRRTKKNRNIERVKDFDEPTRTCK